MHLFLSRHDDVLIDFFSGDARADGTPLSRDSLYRIASMTKPLTIAVALMLIEQGRLGLDQAVASILPGLDQLHLWTGEVDASGMPIGRRYDGAPMTVRHLIEHRAGFSYSFHAATPIDALYAREQIDSFHPRRTADDYISALAAMPLQYPPGERFHYSLAIDVLGVVLEQVTGLPIDELLRQRLFDPLCMTDSFFVVPSEKLGRLTDAWQKNADGQPMLYDRGARSRWRMRPKMISAGGGLISSVADYHRFLTMLMHHGQWQGRQILSAESVAMMLNNSLPGGMDLEQDGAAPVAETSLRGVGMGMGGAVLLDPDRADIRGSVGSWHWGGLLSTGFFMDRTQGLIGLVMTQLMPSGATQVREEFRRAVYDAMQETWGE